MSKKSQHPRSLNKVMRSVIYTKTIRDHATGELYWYEISGPGGLIAADNDGSVPPRENLHGPFKTVEEVFEDQKNFPDTYSRIDTGHCKPQGEVA